MIRILSFLILCLSLLASGCVNLETSEATTNRTAGQTENPLPSWNDGSAKQAILDFVAKTTKQESPAFIPEADRIAVFDNDGTLWSEQPVYFQLAFAMDRIREMAEDHPEWKDQQPYQALLEGDLEAALSAGEHAMLEVLMTTHAGMSTERFHRAVSNWLSEATHPKTGRPYREMIYQPMLELLQYLRANGFKTFIVSGGGVDFMRVWTEEVYGIPPEQVVGSSGKVEFQVRDGRPQLVKLPAINFIDDKEGKPVGIHQYIGKRPVFAAGNSDGDYAMLQWTTSGMEYPRFGMLIHHTDSLREWAYDRNSSIGRLDKGLDDAPSYGWTIVDMAADWKTVYPFEKE